MRGLVVRSWRGVKRFSARTPLRIKLTAGALALVIVALAVISAVSIAVFRGYLVHQADQQLTSVVDRALAPAPASHVPGLSEPGGFKPFPGRIGVGGVAEQVLDRRGHVLAGASGGPAVPAKPAWLAAHAGVLVNLPAHAGGASWRVVTEPVHYVIARELFTGGSPNMPGVPSMVVFSGTDLGVHGQQNGTLVAGVDLGSIGRTIDQLTIIDLAVSGIVIVLLAGVGVALVRASLRPLAEIEQTAGAIAAGDLSRRVPDRDPRTEVGSLGRSLNMMLGQIETAFRARSASEATARQSEERMRRFVADASHELRTPLSVIRGFAEYHRQRGGLEENELNRMIRRVEDEAARMGVLVDDLLLLARLDQQRPIQRKPVDLLALAADAVQDARVLAPGRDIQLTVGSNAAFLVLGDEARLRQIIANLMNNALTHTPEATPIEVRLRSGALGPADPAYPAVVLEVADNGPGLTAEQAERVFERFYRADAARTRKTGGTGLGLAIVNALTLAHGGTASVDSEPGRGATFRITLPLAPDATGTEMTSAEALDSPVTAPVTAAGEDGR